MRFAHCSFLDTRQSNELAQRLTMTWNGFLFSCGWKNSVRILHLADYFNQSFAVDCRGLREFDTVNIPIKAHGFDGLYLARRIFGGLGEHGRVYFSGVGRYSLVKTFITVKPDVLFRATLQTSAAMLVFWLAVCSEQFATSSNNLVATVANLLA